MTGTMTMDIRQASAPAGNESRMRVCLVSLHSGAYVIRLAQALSVRVELLVVVYHDNAVDEVGDEYTRIFAEAGVQLLVLRQPRRVSEVLSNWQRLRRGVRDFDPQVLHMQEGLRDELVWALPWLRNYPLVLTVHDPQPHSGRDARIFRFSRYRLYRWWVRRNADLVFAHGAHLVELLEQDWPGLRGRVHSVPHGPVGPIHCHPGPALVEGPMSLLFFGRIHAYKGLGAFVDLVIRLSKAGLPVLGVVAGRGDDLERHRATMAAAGCFEIRDRYVPPAEADELFSQAHVVVLPYTDGTQSGVAAMALGHGRPVVATAVGAIPDLVRDGVNGLLVPPGDADALHAAVSALVSDAALHRRLAAGARSLADGELSWAAIADETVRWYVHSRKGLAPTTTA